MKDLAVAIAQTARVLCECEPLANDRFFVFAVGYSESQNQQTQVGTDQWAWW
jgi:hypothetical protein